MSKFFKVGFTLRSNRVDEDGKVPVLIRISLRGIVQTCGMKVAETTYRGWSTE